MGSSCEDNSLNDAPRLSPFSLVALHDLLGQKASDAHAGPLDGPGSTTPDTTVADVDRQSCGDSRPLSVAMEVHGDVLAHGDEGGASSSGGSHPDGDDTPDPNGHESWLAIRMQVTPTKKLGSRGDWIRGWSISVSTHGDNAYCACSELPSTGLGGPGKARIHERRGRPGTLPKPASDAEATLCSHCKRRPSPPEETELLDRGPLETTSWDSTVGQLTFIKSGPLRSKLSRYFRLLKPGRKDHAGVEEKKIAAAPKGPRNKSSSEYDPDDEVNSASSTSDSRGVSRSRLERAQAMLDRARNRDG